MGLEGAEIQKELIDIKKRQRWLLHYLRGHGFSTLSESRLSSILTDDYIGGCAPAVKEASAKAIKDYKAGRIKPEEGMTRYG
jgi:hypothetical protein